MEEVENRIKSNLQLQPKLGDQSINKSLPFTVLTLEGSGSQVAHLFEVKNDDIGVGVETDSSSAKARFGVVTLDGRIIVYDTMFRRIFWQQQTGVEDASWGSLFKSKDQSLKILISSRKHGFHVIPQHLSSSPSTNNELLDHCNDDIHVGFCKPISCSQQDVLLPVGLCKLGHLKICENGDKKPLKIIHEFTATLMSIKEIRKSEGSSSSIHVLCTNDDGSVSLLNVDLTISNSTLITSTSLPKHPDDSEPLIGLCTEYFNETFIVGSSGKYIFLLKWGQETDKNVMQPIGKKILPTEGISCLAINKNTEGSILAAGGFDGTVRLFSLPNITQISIIYNQHTTQINTLLFVNERTDKSGRWYLLSCVNEPIIYVWNIQSVKVAYNYL